METRTNVIKDLSIRQVEGSPTKIAGYAAIFNVPSQPLPDLGGKREVIAPGAFTRALADGDNCILTINHDPNLLLARTSSGTLRLKQDDIGLFFEADLPDTSAARDLIVLMNRGDINQNSFQYVADKKDWETRDGQQVRVVKDLHLFDVSIVVNPAFTQTFSVLRSMAELAAKENPTEEDKATFRDLLMKTMEGLNTNVQHDALAGGVAVVKDDSVAINAAKRKRQIQILEIQ